MAFGDNPKGEAAHPVGILAHPPSEDFCQVLGPDPEEYTVRFTYKNWRGETSERRVIPIGMGFGKTEWHPVPQWSMIAYDLDREAIRYFAPQDISNWRPA